MDIEEQNIALSPSSSVRPTYVFVASVKYMKNSTRSIEAIVIPAENCFGYFTKEESIKLKEKLGILFCLHFGHKKIYANW